MRGLLVLSLGLCTLTLPSPGLYASQAVGPPHEAPPAAATAKAPKLEGAVGAITASSGAGYVLLDGQIINTTPVQSGANASAINLGSITEVPLKRFDLMNGIQVRGTYAVSQACIPHMVGRENPHILTLSPPVLLEKKWLKPTPYMMAKYGMTLCALGMAEELREAGIASNTLWPRTMVATAAVQNLLGGE